MKDIGITGTRKGGTSRQLAALRELLTGLYIEGITLHFGDCIGIDEESTRIARPLGYRLQCYPPIHSLYRAYVRADEYEPPLSYAARNAQIVKKSEVLIACPLAGSDQTRSGTWQTIGIATSLGKPVIYIFSNGRVIREP